MLLDTSSNRPCVIVNNFVSILLIIFCIRKIGGGDFLTFVKILNARFMEQLSKFSRIAWMSICGLMLLKIGLILLNPTGILAFGLSYCVDLPLFALLGGWFVVLRRNSNRRSPLYQPALIGIIAASFMVTVSIVQMIIVLDEDPIVPPICQIGDFVAVGLLIWVFVLLGRRSPVGKFRKAAYIAAFIPLIIAILSQILPAAVQSMSSSMSFDESFEMLRRYYICSNLIFCVLSYGAYAFFAYTMDSKK